MTVSLQHVRVRDAMHQGIFCCAGDTPVGEVAEIMATHRVHAVAVVDGRAGAPSAVVTDLDIVAAMAGGEARTAGQAAVTRPPSVSVDDRLDRAAQLMARHRVSHLIVTDAAHGHPIGILSTLDLAAVYAAARATDTSATDTSATDTKEGSP